MNDPSLLPAMYNAVLHKANSDATFKAKVDASAMRVLTAKQNRGLLSQGMDVSSAQGSVDWQAAFNLGARFAYVKATEGTTYTNPSFAQQYNGSYNIGMIRGAYHFAHPDSSTGLAQADYFLAHGGGWSGTATRCHRRCVADNPRRRHLLRAVDGRRWSPGSRRSPTSMHLKTNKYPMINTPFSWWNTCTGNSSAFATTNPFWLASYTSSPPTSIPAGTAHLDPLAERLLRAPSPVARTSSTARYSQLQALATNAD